MIDTVCLTIPQSKVIFMDKTNNKIPSWHLYARTDSYTKYVRNPSKVEKETGQYFPRITAYKRGYQREQQIKIEFSAPKLLFLNNLEELSDNQFEEVVETLQNRLQRMGVSIFKINIIEASVTSIHFGRNIRFTDGQTATGIIDQLARIDLRKSFDFARARFINDGQSLCCHTSTHELVFYDKIADLKKGQKRSIDRDQTDFQLNLFDTIRSRNVPNEILRMEVRLVRKQKLNSVFKKLNLPQNPTFKQVFNSEVSKKVLWEYWNGIIKSKNQGSFMIETTPIKLLEQINAKYPNIKPKQLLARTSLILLSQTDGGLRELRSIVEKNSTSRSWGRLKKEYAEVSNLISTGMIRNWVLSIEKQLKNYQPLVI
jgi:hypothetical protein